MPLATLRKLVYLAKGGAKVIFEDKLPEDVPGWSDLEQKRKEFQNLLVDAQKSCLAAGEVQPALEKALLTARREPMSDRPGLHFVRRLLNDGLIYFIANCGTERIDDWIPLGTWARLRS
jgi:hypothetical protein